MTQSQYNELRALFNECSDDFWLISETMRDEFFDILFDLKKVSNQS